MKFAVVFSEDAEPAMDEGTAGVIKGLGADAVLSRNNLNTRSLAVDAVIVIGGDGTLFYTTHYLQTGYLIGLHIGGKNSKGHFFKAKSVAEVKKILKRLEKGDTTGFGKFSRLKASVVTATGRVYSIDKAFNDYAIGNTKFGLPSKYSLHTDEARKREFQRSSGIVVPTLQGLTGWAKNIAPQQFEELTKKYSSCEDTKFPYLIREPMEDYGHILGFTKKLTITSDMHEGVVAVDGFRQFPLERGDNIIIERSSQDLWLYTGTGGA